MDSPQSVSKRTVMPRACRNCRIRKVRCNRVAPCSNCTTSGLACPLDVESIARPKEDKIDSGDRDRDALLQRLSALEEIVNSLQQQQGTSQSSHTPSHLSEVSISDKGGSDGKCAPMEGESSFGRQLMRAGEIAELTASDASHSPSLLHELANFRDMTQNHQVSQSQRFEFLSGLREESSKMEVELPPQDFIIKLLRKLKELKGVQCVLFTYYGLCDVAQIEDLSRRVYFPVEPLARSEAILFNGMLHIILGEIEISSDHGFDVQELKRHRALCEKNFQTGVETFEVMAIPTHENAMILAIAMIEAQKKSKLALQWSLASTAAKHCLTLGYHREHRLSSLNAQDAERIRWLFWHVYVSDKNIASRLGRSSTIQDFDVDVNLCTVSSDPRRLPWDLTFASFVELARIQGQIYESLYSSAALKRDGLARSTAVTNLESQLTQWHDNWMRIDTSNVYGREVFDVAFGPTTIIYCSIRTLIHRGSTLSTSAQDISPACFEAASQGLKAHLLYYPKVSALSPQAISSYAGWILYYISFTPFVVTFVHCIAYNDLEDLKLLQDTINSLEQIGAGLEYVERQLKMCRALYRIAEAFLNSQNMVMDEPISANNVYLPLPNPSPSSFPWLDFNLQLSNFTSMDNWDSIDVDPHMF